MKLLLVHPYFLAEDPAEHQVMRPYPPLGLLYLSAYVKQHSDWEVGIFDGTFKQVPDFAKEVARFEPDVIGFYANMMTRRFLLKLLEWVPDKVFTVVGGPDVRHYASQYLDQGIKVTIFGEGEERLVKVLDALDQPQRLLHIDGIAYRDPQSGETTTQADQKPSRDLASYPLPDRRAIDLNRYLDCWEKHHGVRPISLITSRGCPYRCTWCAHHVFGYSLRKRPVYHVLEEMEWLAQHYQFDHYWFADDVFTIQPKWVSELADALQAKPHLLKPFECISRADRLNANVIEDLERLQCSRVWVGAESGSQRLLDLMKRGVTREQVINSVSLLRQAGIETGMFFMWGFDDETLEDIEATIDLAQTCQPDLALTTVAYPIKGTAFFDSLAQRNLVTEVGFTHGTDRDTKIGGQRSKTTYAWASKLLQSRLKLAGSRRLSLRRSLRAAQSRYYRYRLTGAWAADPCTASQ